MHSRTTARPAWPGTAVATGLLVLVAGALAVEPRLRELGVTGFVERFDAFRAVGALAFGLPGALVVTHRPGSLIGRLMLGVGAVQAVSLAMGAYGLLGINDPGLGLPLADPLMWLSNWLWAPAYLTVPTLFLLLFPDGALPSRRWRPAAALAAAAVASATLGWALLPVAEVDVAGMFPPGHTGVVPVLPWLAPPLQAAGLVLGGCATAAAVASLVHRHRTASGAVRRQVQWVLAAGIVTVALLGTALTSPPGGPLLLTLAPVPLPAAIAVAVARHRLWDVDLLLARTLTLSALTATLLAAYAGCVLALGRYLDAGDGLSPAGVAVAAALVQPAYTRIHARANQLVFGDRDDPVAALRRLGARLSGTGDPGELLGQVAESVGRTLRVRHVAVEEDGAVVAEWGGPGGPAERVPLRHRGREIGALVVGEPLRSRDRAVLAELAPHVAVTVRAHRLGADLARSHQRLLAAREEERSRLLRELHDGVGPTLAALAFQADRGRRLVAGRSPEAERLLDDLAARIRSTVADVRAIVDDLRPPPLDGLGLAGALAELGRGFAGSLAVEVDAGGGLPPIPAAVELAAYRIAAEALSNAARHAGASRCAIRLRAGRELEIRVDDDGAGVPERPRAGVGLGSMRRRAAELGGSFEIRPAPGGGTGVLVRLPLQEAAPGRAVRTPGLPVPSSPGDTARPPAAHGARPPLEEA
ncbi:sensor histidine kinase [Planomonospora venezuelensis]|uniref:Oxygen sensor histidine kinase NreB n=2 Tax=Actinomycetes TaxID=1760 RepID=A0A841DFX2_PLAVE|nr:sensor histidine kinase [Planomonospora venezuelensis]MBB5966985.1 signal transduction histidine kinase [Planomonospora venezuelensis]